MFNQEKGTDYPILNQHKLESIANLKLAMMGQEYPKDNTIQENLQLASPLLEEIQEQTNQTTTAPIDQRLQTFLNSYFKDTNLEIPQIPNDTFILDREGLARVLSFAPNKEEFKCETMSSYKLKQGVLHNPAKDKRTTQGVFHICEGSLPVPGDKIECPKSAFVRMLKAAFYEAPENHLILPYTSECEKPTKSWVSLYMRPVVVPGVEGVKGFEHEKSTEMHFFVPGNMVCCLDFVEGVFGNAGNPKLSKNDAALDPLSWTGHTGMAILAPHLTKITKKECGLPHVSQATERQKKERMCWENENELYNDGNTFKMYARDASGFICTIIADNYFGYCKKEVKTQISFSANLYGLAEEEHAGGAIARPSYDLGEACDASKYSDGFKFTEMIERNKHSLIVKEEGYAIDKKYPNGIIYVPEDSVFNIEEASIKFKNYNNNKEETILLIPKVNYVLPNGYVIILHDTMTSRRWTLRGILPKYTLCHKPCTVSGGGKSEISKSIRDAVIEGSVFINNKKEDFEAVQEVLDHDFSNRFKEDAQLSLSLHVDKEIHILDSNVTLGTVVELLTPSKHFTEEHNAYVSSIPPLIIELVMTIKSLYREEWKGDWQSRITVDKINGKEGNELKYRKANLSSQYLRVGFERDESTWRVFQLRKDFFPAAKLQMEDDITASVIVPTKLLKTPINSKDKKACKIVKNCELRLFQRPDDAVFRGFDKQTEYDFSIPGHFISNYQPMTREECCNFTKDVVRLYQYTQPIRECLQDFAAGKDESKYIVSSSYTRLVKEGDKLVGSKNPRYLQRRPDLLDPEFTYMTYRAIQLHRKLTDEEPLYVPVDAVLSGRRNNPPQIGKNGMKLRPLSVFAPLHYFELPELLMECITSMTGASPSMFGAGSEGALTKGPFNALPAVVDLNNYLLGMICCGYSGFVSSASYCGPHYKVAHDISLLIPEIWSKMRRYEQEPSYLLEHGFLEPCPDVTYNGKTYSGKRLGYRITTQFTNHFLRTLFSIPNSVMPEDMLKPEMQDLEIYADSYEYIAQTDKGVALNYVNDGTVEGACPPLKALIYIMAHGEYNGMTRESPEFRKMFDPEVVLNSEWYKERLACKQKLEVEKLKRDIEYLNLNIAGKPKLAEELKGKVKEVQDELDYVSSPQYLVDIDGSIGTDPYPHNYKK